MNKSSKSTRSQHATGPGNRRSGNRRGQAGADDVRSGQSKSRSAAEGLEPLLKRSAAARQHYVLRLYVTGNTARSAEAIANIRALCDEHLAGRYDLQVVDIYQQPEETQGEQIIAAPTLVKKLPIPPRRMIGNLHDRRRILLGLDIRPQPRQDGKSSKSAGKVRWVEI